MRKKTLRGRFGRPSNVGQRMGGRTEAHRKARTSKTKGTTKRTGFPFLDRFHGRGRLREIRNLPHSNYVCPCGRIFKGRQRLNWLRVINITTLTILHSSLLLLTTSIFCSTFIPLHFSLLLLTTSTLCWTIILLCTRTLFYGTSVLFNSTRLLSLSLFILCTTLLLLCSSLPLCSIFPVSCLILTLLSSTLRSLSALLQ